MVARLPVRPSALAAALLLAVGAAGCGSGDASPFASGTGTTTASGTPTTTGAAPTTTGTTPRTTPSSPPGAAEEAERRAFPDLRRLQSVPQEGDGTADPTTRRIAERWFDLVRRGENRQAGDLMADGTRFANIVILKLQNRAARTAAAEGLPCGAVPTDVGGAAGGYVVLTLRLTNKAGEPPCEGAGAPVAVAVHVTDGRIDDWVRVGAADAPVNQGTPV
jgi:hypothetical protein